MKTIKWYKYGVFWRRGDGDNDYSPQDREDGVIDFLFNAMTKYRRDGVYCADAMECFKESAALLKQHKRYPDEFLTGNEVRVWWMYYVRKYLRKLGFKVIQKYRSQNDMTRDPYKAFGALYAFLYKCSDDTTRVELTEIFNSVKIPFRIRRGTIIKWWKRFKKDDRKHFVKRLTFLEAIGTKDWYLANDEDDFYKDTDETTNI